MASVTTSDSAKEHEEGTKKAKKNHNNRKDFTDTGQDQNTLEKKIILDSWGWLPAKTL